MVHLSPLSRLIKATKDETYAENLNVHSDLHQLNNLTTDQHMFTNIVSTDKVPDAYYEEVTINKVLNTIS